MTIQRGTPLKRSRMKTRKQTTDWQDAIRKVQEEGRCRICGSTESLEAAHVVPRACSDEFVTGPRGGQIRHVPRDAIVPLCRGHHEAYDSHRLDLMPFLLLPEQTFAVRAAGGIVNANRRISGRGA